MDQEPRALIKRHNEYVREQVVHDLEALEEKLNVKRQMSEKTHAVVDKAKGTLGMNQTTPPQDAKGFVRTNAVPLAAVGLGGALLARNAKQMQAQKQRFATTYPVYSGDAPVYEHDTSNGGGISAKASGMKDAATSKVSGATSTVSDKAGSVKDSMSGTMSSAGSKVSDASTMAAVRASEMKDTVIEKVPSRQQTLQAAKQNAPMVGIAAMALGALAGVFMPRTRIEEERLAPIQESVMDKATEAVEGTVDKTKGALQAGAEKVQSEMGSGDSSASKGGSTPSVDPLVTTPNRITSGTGATNGMSTYGTPAGSL